MSAPNNGGPAFPTGLEGKVALAGERYDGAHVPRYDAIDSGMTLRDYFAAKAMHGLIVDPDRADQSREECARLAYAMADAMLKAREVKS